MILAVVLVAYFFILHYGIADEVLRTHMLASRVSGGIDVPLESPYKYPFLVFLQLIKYNHGDHWCHGSVIAKRWILTAAHCKKDLKKYSDGGYMIYIYNSNIDYKIVQHWLNHPDYDGDNNDIALLYLYEDITTKSGPVKNTRFAPVTLATTYSPTHTKCTILGWGLHDLKDYPPGHGASYMQEAEVYTTDCVSNVFFNPKNLERFNENSILCTSTKEGRGICLGDTGGPLVVKDEYTGEYTQIGVASAGVACATGEDDIFTDVAFYQKWLNDTMRDYD